jgi:hypothetical protein
MTEHVHGGLPHSHGGHTHHHGGADARIKLAAAPTEKAKVRMDLAPAFSILRLSLASRLALAIGLAAIIWAATRWAMS